ncbi:MAG: ABC transporter ATP-binding protein [Myxococcales bacterium]|nr:ABC transporter ATP-binding protein [Myxococcales bacterium]
MSAPPPLCEAVDLSVRYGSLWANRGVSLAVRPGEVVALVGENGAGKSTLLHALYGLVPLDGGQVRYHGQPVVPSPQRAIAAGLGLVHQHFMLVPPLTVAENVILGQEPRKHGLLDRRRAEEEVRALAVRHGLAIDPRRPVADLSVGEAQRVEILKVLYRGARLLILDEPTAVLTPAEAEGMLRVLRQLVSDPAGGRGLLLVTHKLDEVMAVADRVVVLRQGELIASLPAQACSPAEIARAMVGRELQPVRRHPRPAGPAEVALAVHELVVERDGVRRLDGVTLQVRAGEVLGIAGVEGNGQTELCAAVMGLLPVRSGSVQLASAAGLRDITHLPVRARREAGLAWVPEDRHRHGLVLDFSLADNLLLGHEGAFCTGWLPWLQVIDRRRLLRHGRQLLDEYDIQPPEVQAPARALSGGNQQKLVVARELSAQPRVILAAQPTRGVDVGAIQTIHAQLLGARDRGAAVLLVSAELDELQKLADRIAVLYRGRIRAVLDNPPSCPVQRARLGELMAGGMA